MCCCGRRTAECGLLEPEGEEPQGAGPESRSAWGCIKSFLDDMPTAANVELGSAAVFVHGVPAQHGCAPLGVRGGAVTRTARGSRVCRPGRR